MPIPFSESELRAAIEHCVAKLEPMLALDGGSVRLLDVRGSTVFVQLQGACVGCPSSGNTLKYGIEKKLKEEIHQDLQVVNVPFGFEERLEEIGVA